MEYAGLKLTHVGCAAISYTLFVVRGIWMMRGSPLLRQPWYEPSLTLSIRHYSQARSRWRSSAANIRWRSRLTAKVIALVLYIALGTVALRHGRTKAARITAWIVAQAVFAYIVVVAVTRNPLPWV